MKSLLIFVCVVVTARCTSIPSSARPVELLRLGENSKVIFNNETVAKLFLDPKLAGHQVVVFSIIGDFRKGKSFLLNYILRYMYAHYKSVSNDALINADDWLGDKNEPLTGFAWGAGVARVTSGMILWSDVFLYENKGEKLAIYIMDTQGLFDHETTSADNAKIFSLSVMIASMQVLNVKTIINEKQLEYLQFATSYAQYASTTQETAPFQNLMFLIRDWQSPHENKFGNVGGKDYLDGILTIRDHQTKPLKDVRKYLKSSFDRMDCFLMPHPGKTVADSSSYDGSWRDIEEEFIATMKDFIELMFSPSKLTTKKINGQEQTPEDLLVFIKAYVDNFKNHLPQTTNIVQATIDKQFTILISRCVDIYVETIPTLGIEASSEENVQRIHDLARQKALKFFVSERKFGTNLNEIQYKKILDQKLEDAYKSWKATTMENIGKLSVLKNATEEQRAQVQIAQVRDIKAKETLQQVIKKTDDVKTSLEQTRTDTAEARVEHEKLLKELTDARIEREQALKREKETSDKLDAMKRQNELIQSQYNSLQRTASSNVGQSLGAVQQQSGHRSVIGEVAGLMVALTPMVAMIFGKPMPPLPATVPAPAAVAPPFTMPAPVAVAPPAIAPVPVAVAPPTMPAPVAVAPPAIVPVPVAVAPPAPG